MNKKQRLLIVGGGTAGWIAAAATAKQLGSLLDITLIESDEVGTVGVGEATIPPMKTFHRLLGVDEREFMRATSATFKLGISFENWGNNDEKYIHSFGHTGQESYLADFQHFWLRGLKNGIDAEFGEYCYELMAAKEGKFATSEKSNISYAYHLDAGKYAKFLREYSEKRGVVRREGKINGVELDQETGFIKHVKLESGEIIEADLFIDCSGFRGLLIEQALHTGYDDWTHWLPCDSAIAVQTKSKGELLPYTRSVAHEAGWRWRIPLQHRTGNGFVFCSKHMSDETAKQNLLDAIDGEPINEPRVIKFKTGRRRKAWNKNCVALGLSSGFLEPLESTSIHLIMTGIIRLLRLFPFDGVKPSLVDEYNMQAKEEMEKIRDFIVLHYKVTNRQDTPFWNHCRSMDVPESLNHRINLFKERAHAYQAEGELFRVDSWTQVMFGQGIMPKTYHKFVDTMDEKDLPQFLGQYRQNVRQAVTRLPSHAEFIEQYCKTPS
ncbi:tryptophan halogenase family protein [Ningiella sp. W23]|uniref:tryptophan halogenase family protein n=1 Tax=Ningiella sp. W23 TaxID=3023715 RepID=UPI0037563E95